MEGPIDHRLHLIAVSLDSGLYWMQFEIESCWFCLKMDCLFARRKQIELSELAARDLVGCLHSCPWITRYLLRLMVEKVAYQMFSIISSYQLHLVENSIDFETDSSSLLIEFGNFASYPFGSIVIFELASWKQGHFSGFEVSAKNCCLCYCLRATPDSIAPAASSMTAYDH